MADIGIVAQQVWERFVDLVLVPIRNPDVLWIAIPLLIATIFMTLYFGRYRKEELGWNTAFGNTMVFLFVAINLIKEMYKSGGAGAWENVYGNSFYLTIAVGLTGASILLMFITYFHLLPKRLAFFVFSTAPINVTIYVIMTIVYADIPADWITVGAGVVFLIAILVVAKILQGFEWLAGLEQVEEEELATVEREEVQKIKQKKKKP